MGTADAMSTWVSPLKSAVGTPTQSSTTGSSCRQVPRSVASTRAHHAPTPAPGGVTSGSFGSTGTGNGSDHGG